MAKDTPASDLDRRKQVRLRVRQDLTIEPQKYEGRTFYVIKDPVSLRYYRFKEQEHFLIRLMDGTQTLDDAQKQFENRFRPDRLTLEDLEHFGQQLLTAGLVQNESPQAGKLLFDRRSKRKRSELMQYITNILYIKVPVFDPEKTLTRMLPYLSWMFTTWFMLLSMAIMLWALMLVLTNFQDFRDKLPSYQEFFSFKTIIYMWAALGTVKVIHEFGHGLSCKAFGGEVHEMGFLILCLSPAMYCNVSDAWMLPNKWKRIIISGAGIYVELMIASLATFVWWNTESHPFVNYMALALMVVCSVSTVVFNGNPLMRFDGYYVLADWLEIPNLRERANRYLNRVAQEYCLGIEQQPEPYMEPWRRTLFLVYAIGSYFYRWIITYVILVFLATFLKPYKLEVISQMMAIAALGSMVGWPLYRLGKNINKRGRLPDMKPIRAILSASVLAGVLFVFFFVPVPVSRVREMGVVQVQEGHKQVVYVEEPAILTDIKVKEGEQVRKGALLAQFTSFKLQTDEVALNTEFNIQKESVENYDKSIVATRNPKDLAELRRRRLSAALEMKKAEDGLEILARAKKNLTLLAPCNGVVMGLPRLDEIGKQWDKEQGTPFCTVGDPSKLQVLVPVVPSDYDLIYTNLKKAEARKETLPVSIRVQDCDASTWTGRVKLDHMPSSEAREIPAGLSNKAGGPLAVKPSSNPNVIAPQNQVYLIPVEFIDPDQSICPGTLAQVKIHCEHRSIAWWVWRSVCATFDIRLL